MNATHTHKPQTQHTTLQNGIRTGSYKCVYCKIKLNAWLLLLFIMPLVIRLLVVCLSFDFDSDSNSQIATHNDGRKHMHPTQIEYTSCLKYTPYHLQVLILSTYTIHYFILFQFIFTVTLLYVAKVADKLLRFVFFSIEIFSTFSFEMVFLLVSFLIFAKRN